MAADVQGPSESPIRSVTVESDPPGGKTGAADSGDQSAPQAKQPSAQPGPQVDEGTTQAEPDSGRADRAEEPSDHETSSDAPVDADGHSFSIAPIPTTVERSDAWRVRLAASLASEPVAPEPPVGRHASPVDGASQSATPPATPSRAETEAPTGLPPTVEAALAEAVKVVEEFEPDTDTSPVDNAWRDSDQLVLPLPPAPPGERGYRAGDVERLMRFLATALAGPDVPSPDELANLKLTRTFFVGQGYHVGSVDVLRDAWLAELGRRAR